MIKLKSGDLLRSDAEALVNTVNTVGVMGRGIALQFKKAFPKNYEVYKVACEKGEVEQGRMFVHERGGFQNPKFIINFPTKQHWRGKSSLEAIECGLVDLLHVVEQYEIKSIAIPPLGSGLGGLNWRDVKRRIYEAFSSLSEVEVFLYEPHGAPKGEDQVIRTEKPMMTLGQAVYIALMRLYDVPGYLYRLSLLELHKLAYFGQEAGIPLKLQFEASKYGPYSKNLRHVLIRMDGHYITGYGEGSDRPETPVRLMELAGQEADNFLNDIPVVLPKLEKVGKLIEGFENPYGMELLSSVYWVAKNEVSNAKNDPNAAVIAVHAWNDRKRKLMQPNHIRTAWNQLNEQSWFR
ncbi:macro domain-containing protein [Calditrichota bacterium]